MNFELLSDEELEIFLNVVVPLEAHRFMYKHIKYFALNLKGFRAETATKEHLNRLSIKSIRKKDKAFIRRIEELYEQTFKDTKDKIHTLIEKGYSQKNAYALALSSFNKPDFIDVFLKLEEVSIEENLYIKESSNMINYVVKETNKSVDKNKADCEKKINSSIKEAEDKIFKTIQDKEKVISNIQIDVKELKDNFSTVINDCVKSKELTDLKNEIEHVKKTIAKKEKDKSSDTVVNIVDNEVIAKLNKKVDLLSKSLNKIKTGSSIKIEETIGEDLEPCNEYFNDNVGDVTYPLGLSDVEEKALKNFLIEIIYSNKPIVCSKENSKFLGVIISSIITAGKYFSIVAEPSVSDAEIIDAIESLPTVADNKVVVIKNRLNVVDNGFLLDYIKGRPFNEKYIFEVLFDKEVMFMPKESVKEFNFYFGKCKLKTIDYVYSFDFGGTNRKALRNHKLEETLENLNISFDEFEIMNSDYNGLLCFSIIPFISNNENKNKEELINNILDSDVRKIAEELINDNII